MINRNATHNINGTINYNRNTVTNGNKNNFIIIGINNKTNGHIKSQLSRTRDRNRKIDRNIRSQNNMKTTS